VNQAIGVPERHETKTTSETMSCWWRDARMKVANHESACVPVSRSVIIRVIGLKSRSLVDM
jgi:hypothetical protein